MTALRPVAERDLAVLDAEYADPESSGEFAWFGFRSPGGRAQQVASGESLRNDGGRLAIVDEFDAPVGEISWRVALNGPPGRGECWQIGIWVAPEARGKGHASAAQRQLAAYLFAHTPYVRVEASTEVGNVGEQRALEKAGFAREGVLRRACFRDGEWRDMVMFSKLRGEA
ncbi:MAG TPA: GNAT family protein [Mycobacteriales bacterium]|nr:GNAT family protein [Mycobacteriales bacterium]